MTKLLLVDFDRTLFDTDQFSQAWWQWLAKTYKVDAARELGRFEDFYTYVGEWRNYDFFAHIGDLSLPQPVDEVLAAGRHALRGRDFRYADSSVVDRLHAPRDVELVTFGNAPYQQYKLSFCPMYDEGWVKHIIEEEKGDFIARTYGGRPTILVDDKMLAGSLPVTSEFIHLDRAQDRPVVIHDTYRSINSLNELEALL